MSRPHATGTVLPILILIFGFPARAAAPGVSELVHLDRGGILISRPYTDRGDTIPDFSNCGYMGGGVRLPDVPAREVLEPVAGTADDRARIQDAIDRVSRAPADRDGRRGAVLLKRGRYRVGDTLHIRAGGVVVRGEGAGESGTSLIATGRKPYPVFALKGKGGAKGVPGTARPIADAYVPVGARQFAVGDASGFHVGDAVLVIRHGNAAWIHEIGMDRIQPRASSPTSTRQWSPFDLAFDRTITAVEGNRLTVDAPITCAIEARWGGGEVVRAVDDGRIAQVGVENLRAVSVFDRTRLARQGRTEYFADERHATYLVELDNVKDAWVRDVATQYFAHGVASLGGGAKWVTVQDSTSTDPVSILTGGRRYTFDVDGQLNLVQRCRSRGGRHAFVLGSHVEGPNVFLDCLAEENHATSEPHHRWSVGGLFDNVSAPLAIQDRQWMGSGHGWAGANYVAWNCNGSLVCQKPPTAQNFAIGFVGKKEPGAFPRPDGLWESYGRHVTPRSLYLAQLAARLGPQAVANIGPREPGKTKTGTP